MAAKKFRKLDAPARDRIAAKLRAVAEDPARHLTKLRSLDAYRLRAVDHRVIVDVDWEGHVLHVLTPGHRSTVYR
ncbi:MAG: type II toxin-antitoxin system RelE/ParE family toxin [Euryarchaeota archaeon]|nr:type II toxin-antitoxin system RelE/ParE family toxin [Euryarchaeota archaeon]